MVEPQEPNAQNESVLSRWSRLKRGATPDKPAEAVSEISPRSPQFNTDEAPVVDGEKNAALEPGVVVPDARAARKANDALAELPSLDDISLDRDFTPFMQAKVPEVLKRQALKTLFKDPHFNVMDGLDIYIDDYTKFEPISAAELEGLSAWKSISKPLQQVVTPGGYAVDVESEEGKAVLAARERLAALKNADERGATVPLDSEETALTDARAPIQQTPPTSPRYGKRVGDFRYEDPEATAATAALTDAPTHPSIASSVAPIQASTDDPR